MSINDDILGRDGYSGLQGEKGLPGLPGKTGRQGVFNSSLLDHESSLAYFRFTWLTWN